MSSVTVTVKDVAGNTATANASYSVTQPSGLVAGGIYFGGNADVRSDTINRTPPINIKGLQQYRSFADGSLYPGYQKTWIPPLVANGVWLNLVMELKHYGASNTNAQTFTVEGRTYTVPAPNMRYRLKIENALAYGYEQIYSGQADGLLHRLLYQLRSIPSGGRINIQIESEVDTDNNNATDAAPNVAVIENGVNYTRAQADARAVQAVTYIARWLKSPPNGIAPLPSGVTLSMGYAGQWSGLQGFINTHPESLMTYLDYMHMNTYNHSVNKTAEANFREILDWTSNLGPIGRSKNIIVSEFGSNAAFTPNQAGYMAQMPAALNKLNAEMVAAGRGRFVMTLWFGSNDTTWGVLSPKEAGLVALQQMLDTYPYK